jgi:hypothetical protein
MEAIELLARLRKNEEELGGILEKISSLEKDIAMIRDEIVDFCKSTENYEVVLGSAIRDGIGQTVKRAKYVSIFSSSLFSNPDFSELVRGKRFGLFRSDSDFAPVVRFLGFDSLGYPDEYKRSRKAAKGLAEEGKTVVVFDKEICFDKMIVPFTEKREET